MATEPQRPAASRWYAALASTGAVADETESQSLSRRILLLGGVLMSGGGLLWGTLSAAYGLPWVAIIPYGYTALTALNFAVFARTRDFRVARFVQVLLSLLLPFAFQWSLGGFEVSGGVMLWAMIAIVGSLSFGDARQSVGWLLLYSALTVGSGVCETCLRRQAPFAPSPAARTAFFVVNVVVISAIVFGLTIYYAHQRWLAIEALEAEQARTRALLAELSEARARAEEAARVKAAFLANMSHEIRTPMNAVIGMSHLALRGPLAPRERDYIGKVHRAGAALLGILDDILDLSKLEAGSVRLEHLPFDVEEFVVHVASIVDHNVQAKGLALEIDLDPALPVRLLGDRLRLGQVLINLAGNAVKFTERGGVRVSLRLVSRSGDRVVTRMAVSDTGIGIDPAQLARLFKPFAQADASTTRRFGGTGLGLSISDRLVRAMGGVIRVDSTPGVGSTFHFEVPFDLAPPVDGADPSPPAALRGVRALVVDAFAPGRELLAARLASMTGEPVASAASHDAAIELARGRPFDLVIVDADLPDPGAIAAARMLRSLAAARARVVLLAGGAAREAARDELALDDLIAKPTTTTTLRDALCALFGGEASPPSEARPTAARLAGLTILLAEDNDLNAEIATANLEQEGASIDVAGDGARALELLRGGTRYDLVLMDVQMPGVDGLAAARALRAEGFGLPVVAMTAHAMAEDREQALAAGMNDHLAKPLDPELLVATIARLCGRRVGAPVRTAEVDAPATRWLDVEDGLRRVAGRRDTYASVVARFVERGEGAVADLRRALGADDRATAQRLLHTLRGVAANLGAHSLAAAALVVEREVRAGQVGAEGVALFERALTGTLAEMAPLCDAPGPDPDPGEVRAVPAREVAECVLAIDALLEQSDADTIAAVEAARLTIEAALGADDTRRFVALVRDFAFDRARALLAPAVAAAGR